MPFRTDHVQAPGLDHHIVLLLPFSPDFLELLFRGTVEFRHFGFPVAAKDNVRAPTRHIGRDGNGARLACLGNNLRLLLVKLGVQHAVFDLVLLQKIGQMFGRFD